MLRKKRKKEKKGRWRENDEKYMKRELKSSFPLVKQQKLVDPAKFVQLMVEI